MLAVLSEALELMRADPPLLVRPRRDAGGTMLHLRKEVNTRGPPCARGRIHLRTFVPRQGQQEVKIAHGTVIGCPPGDRIGPTVPHGCP